MMERRKLPVDRCPERIKNEIARASVSKLIKRVIFNTKLKPKR